ncbi:MAG: 4-phosphoerythronate dehydrogenase, partial [Candidatus Hydrogenedentes bacterium]|nr:4-phosphoerythronate dehydrogenase [Candidatus Hydrogenedentota bacterium]
MPYAEDAFGSLGDLDLLPGHRIDRDAVREADALLVRSVTRIDAQLLAGSRVGFVGTATSGFDHIDLDHLSGRGVRFAYAPGSNANSVAEYVVAALLTISEARGLNLQGARVGIIGCG